MPENDPKTTMTTPNTSNSVRPAPRLQTPDIYYAVAHRSQAEIDSFKTRYQEFDTSLIPHIFQQSLSLEVAGWEQSSSWGTSHVIYYVRTRPKVTSLQSHSSPVISSTHSSQPESPRSPERKRLVLRANLGFNPQPEVLMQVEQLLTNKVLAIGVPTNKVLYVDISRKHYPFDFQIEEELLGQDVEDHFTGTQEEYDALSFELGRCIAKYQDLTFDKFGLFDFAAVQKGQLIGTKDSFFDYITVRLDDDIHYLVEAKVVTPQVAKRIRRLFDERRDIINIERGSLVHHDLADHNLMCRDNRLTAIFDWEAAVIGDPVLDLASCPTWRTHYPREAKLIEGYASVRPLPDNFQAKMDIYRLRTMLWKIVFAIRAGTLDEKRVARFQGALQPYELESVL